MQDKRKQQLEGFCASQNIQMHDLELLDMALTHTSYAHEAKQTPKLRHSRSYLPCQGLQPFLSR